MHSVPFCCINMVVFTLVPVTVERSVSVFLLAQMDANNTHVYSEDEMGTLLKEDYIDKNGAVQKRCEEQIATDLLKKGRRIYHNGKGSGHSTAFLGLCQVYTAAIQLHFALSMKNNSQIFYTKTE